MHGGNERVTEGSTSSALAGDYVAPALTVLGQVRDLTASHHHHPLHRHWGDRPGGLHPPGFPPPLFHGSA
jgi:hypothetical protein